MDETTSMNASAGQVLCRAKVIVCGGKNCAGGEGAVVLGAMQAEVVRRELARRSS